MLRKYIPITFSILLISGLAHAQFADIRGVVIGEDGPLVGAQIILTKDGVRVKALVTNPEGEFVMADLSSGDYQLTAKYIGLDTFRESLYLEAGQSLYKKLELTTGVEVKKIIVVRSGPKTNETRPFKPQDFIKGPYNNVLDLIGNDPLLTTRGGKIQFSTARPEQTSIVKDNVSQIGPIQPTFFNLGQVKVLSVGVPAMYGDFVGGVIEFTSVDRLDTTSVSHVMLRSSSLFNAYHQNALETFWYKPLIVDDGQTKLGITHSLFAEYQKDPNPSAVDLYTLKESSRSELTNNPFVTFPGGLESTLPNSFSEEDFEHQKARPNASLYNVYSSLRASWKPNENVTLSVEPSYQFRRQQQFSFSNSLLNSAHNPVTTSHTAKLNAQISHTLKRPYNSKGEYTYDSSLISKVGYIIIADYQRFNTETADPTYGDRVFDYGYIGSFQGQGQDMYEIQEDAREVTDQYGNKVMIQNYQELNGYQDTALVFAPSSINSERADINTYVMRNYNINSPNDLSTNQGLRNGQNPNVINSMWYAPGTVISNYVKTDFEKINLNAIVNLSVNPTYSLKRQHDIQIGMLYEQRRRSFYSLNANTLWQLMPQLVNTHIGKFDKNSAVLSYDSEGLFTDTVTYSRNINTQSQGVFDKNVRAIVPAGNGYYSGGGHFIDIHSFDPSAFTLDMFSADELWNNGNTYVSYAGYDHTGKRLRRQHGLGDFLQNTNERLVNAYTPSYAAIWFQDKFVLEKIKIRAGVRIERFDANQLTLRDEYSLYPVKTVAETDLLAGIAVSHPTTISPDAVVYVDDVNSPTKVVGYRTGSKWYSQAGEELSSGASLASAANAGKIQPYLVDPQGQEVSQESFKDYSPEILILPRLSFSFPMNSTSMFYAYYDKFAQRPSYGQSFAPISSYYFLEANAGGVVANPNLKAAKRTDYQFGYKQTLGLASILNIRVGYAQIKDDINLVRIENAYPQSYTTYSNQDFSTVKSFGADYVLAKKKITFKVSYLLQFADGTGSNANSASALIQAGQPNLRSLYPLEYDIRHKINANASFDLSDMCITRRGILSNTSLSIFGNAQSGTPFTALANAVPEAQSLGVASRSQIDGNPFGSRMPWNYSLDLALSKSLIVRGKPFVLQVNARNLLNLTNIYNVYAHSASASDDGYLASPQGQQQVKNELNAQSFVYYYNLKQNSPDNFGAPRNLSVTLRSTF
jgi:hypothetical protein